MYIVNNYFYLVVSHESAKLETIFTGNGRSDKNKELPVRVTYVIKKIPRINVQLFEISFRKRHADRACFASSSYTRLYSCKIPDLKKNGIGCWGMGLKTWTCNAFGLFSSTIST